MVGGQFSFPALVLTPPAAVPTVRIGFRAADYKSQGTDLKKELLTYARNGF
jgi:hypothetical protein